MVDVDQIQKINSLAQDLLRQGIAKDHEDAFHQAERVYQKQAPAYQEFKETFRSVEAQARPKAPENPLPEDLSSEKIQDILVKNKDFLVKKIREFQEKMEAMEQEIAILKTKVVASSAAVRAAAVQQESRPSSASSASSSSSSTQSHPRLGNYKEGDVSIEKFFYAGNKK
ncbi:hypothetical protein HYU22_04435 [Candidatus Woesearchaeota archaeon]|nr:hypothetical protein [Candidatus Woesearchaeota archaeon]